MVNLKINIFKQPIYLLILSNYLTIFIEDLQISKTFNFHNLIYGILFAFEKYMLFLLAIHPNHILNFLELFSFKLVGTF